MNRDLIKADYEFADQAIHVVVPNSRRDGEVRPWHPVYWKTLPFGYRLGYSAYSYNERQAMGLSNEAIEEIAIAQAPVWLWYRSVFPPHEMSR